MRFVLIVLAGAAITSCSQPKPMTAQVLVCRGVINLQCSPDMCRVEPLAGGHQSTDGWIAGQYGTTQNRFKLDAAKKKLELCWNGKCRTGAAQKVWAAGAVSGATGKMDIEFGRVVETVNFTYMQEAGRGSHYFRFAAYPSGEEGNNRLVEGDCQ